MKTLIKRRMNSIRMTWRLRLMKTRERVKMILYARKMKSCQLMIIKMRKRKILSLKMMKRTTKN